MKKYQLRKGSTSLESLELIECDVPEPGEQQLLIRVHAASLNFRDQAIVTGNYFGGVLKRDTVPLSDGAGEVVAVGRNVTINAVLPGPFDTDRLRTNHQKAADARKVPVGTIEAERKATVPAGRFGTPAEFGAAVAFLCSQHAGFITGQNLLLDGGLFPGSV